MINTVITLPSLYEEIIPNKATQTREEFANNVYPFMVWWNDSNVPQLQTLGQQINSMTNEANSTVVDMNSIKSSVDSYKTSTYNYMNTTEGYKDEALGAKNDILGYVIPNGTAYSVEQVDENLNTTLTIMVENSYLLSLVKGEINGV